MSRIQHIYDEIYRQNIYYVCCPSYAEFCKIMKKELDMDWEQKQKDVDGNFAVIENSGYLIGAIFTKDRSPDTVAHECLHAVSFFLRSRGIPLNDDTEEAYTYYLQFLVREICGKKRLKRGR